MGSTFHAKPWTQGTTDSSLLVRTDFNANVLH